MRTMDDANKARRKEIGLLIRKRRENIGMTIQRLAAAVGWDIHQPMQKIEVGERGVTADELVKIAEALDIDPRTLIGSLPRRRHVALYGYIGVGAEYFAHAGSGRWMEIEKVEAPLGDEAVNAAVRVVGSSLGRAFRDGDLLFFQYPSEDHLEELIGKRCIAKLRDSEKAVACEIERAAKGGKYVIRTLAADSVAQEVTLEWASRIRLIQPA